MIFESLFVMGLVNEIFGIGDTTGKALHLKHKSAFEEVFNRSIEEVLRQEIEANEELSKKEKKR